MNAPVYVSRMQIPNRHYLIVDFEATCSDDGSVPRTEMEIIEIGALLQNARTFEVESEFQTFVRPVRHPSLTSFCTQLTTITQADVSRAPAFPEAATAMTAWLKPFDDFLFSSWGDYDRNQLKQDCEFHNMQPPLGPGHLNLKRAFAEAIGRRKLLGIGGALRHLGIEFDGTPHRGIDDVRNIARIVRRVCAGD